MAIDKTLEVNLTMDRQQYLEGCTRLITEHREKELFVIYIRQRRAKFAIKTDDEAGVAMLAKQSKEIRSLLALFPNLTPSSYLRLQISKGMEAPTMDRDHDCTELKVFRTVRSILRSNSSPIIGCIVGFKEDDQQMIGWSLCNTSMGDTFDKRDGTRRAIVRAQTLSATQTDIRVANELLEEAKKARADVKEFGTPLPARAGLPVPHSCLRPLEQAVHRVTKE